MNNDYCNDITKFSRLKTREIYIGDVGIGGHHPIRIQSMTTTDTMDTELSVNQSIKMIEAGCEIVRLTAPNIKAAHNLYNIKNLLSKRGYKTPLVADIHFTPNAAIEAAKIVEKIRINPGNYSDKKKFQTYNYSDSQYLDELKRIEDKMDPLVQVCKRHKTVLRIGTNHGSLSDRIMSKYGDTPLGMVESALEFVRICEKLDFKELVLSMKASNPIVMIQAYRLLINKMNQENMNYPLHLGVTEAGDGDDGRIKSAIGIGSLLVDGIGDTIRVSLTEPPEHEIPVAKMLKDYVEDIKDHKKIMELKNNPLNPFAYSRRKTHLVVNLGVDFVPVVIADISYKEKITPASLYDLGYKYSVPLDKWNIDDAACDYVFLGNNSISFGLPGSLRAIYHYSSWDKHGKGYPMFSLKEYIASHKRSSKINFLRLSIDDLNESTIDVLKGDKTLIVLMETSNKNSVAEQRRFCLKLINNNIKNPVIIHRHYSNTSLKKIQIKSSVEMGALLLDGLGDGIFLTTTNDRRGINKLMFNILQSTRTRISKTEYISCPSCGRTLFDLEETTAKIRNATSHLKGLKIGIMGCIVNGPGEMADADYGYVGTGSDRISLYKKQKMVKKNIKTEDALIELINLIKANGDWVNA